MPLPIRIAIPEQNLVPILHRAHRDHNNHRHAIDQGIQANSIGLRAVTLARAVDMVQDTDPLARVQIHFTDRGRCLIHRQKIDRAIVQPHVAVHVRVWIVGCRPSHNTAPITIAARRHACVESAANNALRHFRNGCIEIKAAGGIHLRVHGQHLPRHGTQHRAPLRNIPHRHHAERGPWKPEPRVHLGHRPRVQLHQAHVRPQQLVTHRGVAHSQRELRRDAAPRKLRAAKLNVIFRRRTRQLGMHRTQRVGEALVHDVAVGEDRSTRFGQGSEALAVCMRVKGHAVGVRGEELARFCGVDAKYGRGGAV